MYQVPGTDIVFACIMTALLMILCYMIGRIYGKKQNQQELTGTEQAYLGLWNDFCMLEVERDALRDSAITQHTKHVTLMAQCMALQQRELTKKHRLALAKHKTKCDAKLAKYMDRVYETSLAELRLAEAKHERPDFSLLLSK